MRSIPISAPLLGAEEKAAVIGVLDSGMLVQGPRVAELERGFASLAGRVHGVAANSGTAALHLALLAHGIGPGDEVVTSPFTFVASVNAILYCQARPVFADIDPATFNLDPAAVERALSARTRAIMPVHLYGQTSDMEALGEIARSRGLILIEDCAQAVGATYRGRPAGSFGTGVFSLYATKNVQSGEGGLVTTDDPELADRMRLLRNQGMRERYRYEGIGYNYRLSDIHAAIGLCQLRRIEEFTARRRRNAERLTAEIKTVVVPHVAEGCEHVWHQYTVRVDGGRDRDAAAAQLGAAGVGCGIYYPQPVSRFDHVRQVAGDACCPVAERAAQEVLSIPVHPALSESDLERIVAEVNRL